MSIPAFAKRVEGRVHCGPRLLQGVIVTDGTAFTSTAADGTFAFDVSDDTPYIQIVTPYCFAAQQQDGIPVFWQEAEGRRWFDFDIVPTTPAEDYTLFAIPSLQITDAEQFASFEEEFIPSLVDKAITARIKGLTAGVILTKNVAPAYAQKVNKQLAKAKIAMYMLPAQGPENQAFFIGKDLVICLKDNGPAAQAFAKGVKALVPPETRILIDGEVPDPHAAYGFIVYSNKAGKLDLAYHGANYSEQPSCAHFDARDKTAQEIEDEVFTAINSGFVSIEAALQITQRSDVILLRDSYPKYTQEKGVDAGQLIDRIEAYMNWTKWPAVRYFFAINSGSGAGEGKVWPEFKLFVDRCLEVLLSKGLGDRLVIESFDDRALNYIHQRYPSLDLCYLVDTECGSYEDFMSLLDFTPKWISFQDEMVNDTLIKTARDAGMLVSVWSDSKIITYAQ